MPVSAQSPLVPSNASAIVMKSHIDVRASIVHAIIAIAIIVTITSDQERLE